VHADYAIQYRELYARHWWWRSREAWLLGWIDQLARHSPLRRILDVGCGDGLFFDRLARYGHVEGLEPDARLVTETPWKGRIKVGSIESGLSGTSRYDLVLMLDVLEHIEDDAQALAAVRGALHPGGRLLLTVPALAWLWSRHDEANEHHRRYGRSDLRAVLEAAGFEVEVLRFFFAWTVVPLLVRRLVAPAGVSDASYVVPIPHAFVNTALSAGSRCEHALGRWIPWPLGSSLLAIATPR
jgi:SAM-dependent methyltransferase